MNIHDLHSALKHLYPDVVDIRLEYTLPDKSDGQIAVAKWPAELGPIPDQATIDAALIEGKRADAIQRLRREAVRRFEEGKRNDVLLARYAKTQRKGVTRIVQLLAQSSDPVLQAIPNDTELQGYVDKLNEYEAKWGGEDLIQAEIETAPDPDVYTDEAIAASPHWGA